MVRFAIIDQRLIGKHSMTRLVLALFIISTATVWSAKAQEAAAPTAEAPVTQSESATAPAEPVTKAVVPATSAPAPVVIPFELRPYKVEIAVVVSDSPRLSPAFRKSLLKELNATADRSIGPMWDLQITAGEWLTPHSRASVERLTVAAMKERAQKQDVDKCYPIAVELVGSRFHIVGREWDRESQGLGAIRSSSTLDRRMLATEIFRVIQQVFRPVIQIDEGDATAGARVRIRAGEFLPADPDFDQAAEGIYYVPFMRALAKDRSLRAVSFVPWCYLSASEVERSRLNCKADSGVGVKFTSKRRSEWRGLGVRPSLPSTELTLLPQRNSTKPLVGYFIALYEELPVDPPPSATPPKEPPPPSPAEESKIVLRTDRFGRATIPVKENAPLQWIFVRSGRELLTKFPIVPGVEASMSAQCPDDTERLDVEGQMALVETELIDTIAKRAVTMAMVKARANKKEWDKVDQGFAEIAELPKHKYFDAKVSEVQYAAIKKAQAKKNRMAEDRIKKMGAKVMEVATFHLDEEKITELKTELADQKAAEDRKAENDEAVEKLRKPGT